MNNQLSNRNSIIENNQAELLLTEQDSKLQSIIEILNIILVNLNNKSASRESQEELILIKQALLALNSNDKQTNTLQKEFHTDTQRSLDTIEQENQDLRSYCQQIKQQLKKQDELLRNQYSIQNMIYGCCAIAILAAVTTVAGIRLFPPSLDSMLPSKSSPELQKDSLENPAKTPRKSK